VANLVEQLKKRSAPTALLYVSDHGESLGENWLYLHGMPWALAPEEQKRVPMLLWMSQSMRERLNVHQDCLEKMSTMPWSHDNLFHTLLGVARISTSAEVVDQDIIFRCQKSMGSATAAPVDRPIG
jgi:lipid A ethanolaminephosphotransferase